MTVKQVRTPKRRRGAVAGTVLAGTMALIVAACGSSSDSGKDAGAVDGPPGTGGSAIGFLYVGTCDDGGYNQAACLGADAVSESFGDQYEVIEAEEVPESAEAERVMEQMIARGAKIIFPTSYGHLQYALNVAERHPDVVFLHQGGLKAADNLGTYFGTIWQGEYLAGMAAGETTESNQLGFVASIPIPQVLANINAFELGAQSVNPDAETTVVFTGDWCVPSKQAEAAKTLIDGGVDVITQHQDCTKTIAEAAKDAGIAYTAYHADVSDIVGDTQLTGAIWNWGPLYVDMVRTVSDGEFADSPYDGQYRVGLADGVVELAPFGSTVPAEVIATIDKAKAQIESGELHPFTGPVRDQAGTVVIKDGVTPTDAEIESTDYLVEGVNGTIPS